VIFFPLRPGRLFVVILALIFVGVIFIRNGSQEHLAGVQAAGALFIAVAVAVAFALVRWIIRLVIEFFR
jgi:hypothetical protein